MRLLLDTHILIWFLEGNQSLSMARRAAISKKENEVFVSIASLWEMAIKISLGKLALAKPLADVVNQIAVEDIEILPIKPEHILLISVLQFHHRDPFDRIIIAQAELENSFLISNDNDFAKYNIKLL